MRLVSEGDADFRKTTLGKMPAGSMAAQIQKFSGNDKPVTREEAKAASARCVVLVLESAECSGVAVFIVCYMPGAGLWL